MGVAMGEMEEVPVTIVRGLEALSLSGSSPTTPNGWWMACGWGKSPEGAVMDDAGLDVRR